MEDTTRTLQRLHLDQVLKLTPLPICCKWDCSSSFHQQNQLWITWEWRLSQLLGPVKFLRTGWWCLHFRLRPGNHNRTNFRQISFDNCLLFISMPIWSCQQMRMKVLQVDQVATRKYDLPFSKLEILI